VREVAFEKSWVQLFGDNDHLLFGSPNANVDLSTLHPEPVKIFRLWQIYLENVNPLLKVTHTPSMQGQIIEAASNVSNISPGLEALLFAIYCMATLSLTVGDCQAMFGSPQEELLTRFQFGCRQALLNCSFLRSTNRDSLTALFLYLVSLVMYCLFFLMILGLGQTQDSSPVSVGNAWGCHSDCATHGSS
jgi:hypothetical protein